MVLPISPGNSSHFHLSLEMPFRWRKAKGNNTKNAMAIRNAPISIGLKTSSPRFIKIKELPQTTAKRTKIPHAHQRLGGTGVEEGASKGEILEGVDMLRSLDDEASKVGN